MKNILKIKFFFTNSLKYKKIINYFNKVKSGYQSISSILIFFKNFKIGKDDNDNDDIPETKLKYNYGKKGVRSYESFWYAQKKRIRMDNFKNTFYYFSKNLFNIELIDKDTKGIFKQNKNKKFNLNVLISYIYDRYSFFYYRTTSNITHFIRLIRLVLKFYPSYSIHLKNLFFLGSLKNTLNSIRLKSTKIAPDEQKSGTYSLKGPIYLMIHKPASVINSKIWFGIQNWIKNNNDITFKSSFSLIMSGNTRLITKNVRKIIRSTGKWSYRRLRNKRIYKKTALKMANTWGNIGIFQTKWLIKDLVFIKKDYLKWNNTKNISFKNLKIIKKVLKRNIDISKKNTFSKFENINNNPTKILNNWLASGYISTNKSVCIRYRKSKISISSNKFDIFFNSKNFGHPFHLVNPSILPITLSFVFFTVIQDILCSFLLEMWYVSIFSVLSHTLMLGLFFSVFITWILEIYSEEQSGAHTLEVQKGFQYAILLFILSELMLFISFFWAYFHFSLNSNSFTGGSYTPVGIVPFFWFRIPLLNTLLLLASGLSLTIAHILVVESDRLSKVLIWLETFSFQKSVEFVTNLRSFIKTNYTYHGASSSIVKDGRFYSFIKSKFIIKLFIAYSKFRPTTFKRIHPSKAFKFRNYNHIERIGRVSYDFQVNIPKSFIIDFKETPRNNIWQYNYWLFDTVIKGLIFLLFQTYEYTSCMFSINDGVYGAVFFSLTGLHGIHVFLGVMFLFFTMIISLKKDFGKLIKGHKSWKNRVHRFSDRGALIQNSYKNTPWTHRIAFDAAAWYWHFVDVVWFFVFVFVYWWGFSIA